MKSKIIALALVVAAMFVFTSCSSKPELDFEKAKENLVSAGYEVVIEDDEECLDVGVVEEFIAYSEDRDDYIYATRYKNSKYAKFIYSVAR